MGLHTSKKIWQKFIDRWFSYIKLFLSKKKVKKKKYKLTDEERQLRRPHLRDLREESPDDQINHFTNHHSRTKRLHHFIIEHSC